MRAWRASRGVWVVDADRRRGTEGRGGSLAVTRTASLSHTAQAATCSNSRTGTAVWSVTWSLPTLFQAARQCVAWTGPCPAAATQRGNVTQPVHNGGAAHFCCEWPTLSPPQHDSACGVLNARRARAILVRHRKRSTHSFSGGQGRAKHLSSIQLHLSTVFRRRAELLQLLLEGYN